MIYFYPVAMSNHWFNTLGTRVRHLRLSVHHILRLSVSCVLLSMRVLRQSGQNCLIASILLEPLVCGSVCNAKDGLLSISCGGQKRISLFNGRNFDGWYVFTAQTQRGNPGVFQVVDGTIYVPGGQGEEAYVGGLITDESYDNYCLSLEYKWGDATYGARKGKARDAGILLHCVGPNPPGPWMTSYEYQIIEGGTGDTLVVNVYQGDDHGNEVVLKCTGESKRRGGQYYFKPGGQPHEIVDRGRLNWWGRDPAWKDVVGFRGQNDLESPHGEWTRCKIIARDDVLEFYTNGKLVNRVTDLTLTKGKILLQTEGAELWYRNVVLTPAPPEN